MPSVTLTRVENAVPTPIARSMPTPTGLGIEPGTWVSRLTWAILFALPTAVFITAAWLTPNPEGHGTHTQLGLPPCGFLVFTGYPCPGCGLTTAFAYMIRLDVIGAWHANPFGIALFLAVALFIPFAALGFVRGWSVVSALDRVHAEKVAIVLALLSVMSWVTRVALISLA
ncbi:Hypothetical protein I5071_15060 [Sandaracinus amylolyticus]|nr:Hypothetical protein I5071_15060 [Sandaracinus amylolyticus]